MKIPGSAAILSLLVLPAAWAHAGSTCVECHQNAEAVSYLEHNFADWKGSPHAKAGVACEACHGGDPAQKDRAAAHVGLRSSRDPKSPVYFTRVPATCGACHAAEQEAFARSRHARELGRTGRGPNCVTCHGSMANHVLAPRELELTCNLCHRRPTKAFATLLSLNTASAALARLDKTLGQARAKGVDVGPQESSQAKAASLYRGALVDWHTFKMDEVLKASQEAARAANVAARELELKEQR
ncbi:MAG: hypothetical protein HY554_03900 [Elusimicrobia bacterium]|nr:hypothetical protein [Elusimicrobiota bacterium]